MKEMKIWVKNATERNIRLTANLMGFPTGKVIENLISEGVQLQKEKLEREKYEKEK